MPDPEVGAHNSLAASPPRWVSFVALALVLLIVLSTVFGAPVVAMAVSGRFTTPWWLGLLALVLTFLLPATFAGVTFWMGRSRERLARYFRGLIRVFLLLVVGLLMLELVLLPAARNEITRVDSALGMAWTYAYATLGLALLFVAGIVLIEFRRLFIIEPIRVTGIVLGQRRLPVIVDRVAHIAAKLRAQAPTQIIVGVEPHAFVVASPIELRGVGATAAAETLFLPASGLRVWTQQEVDAIIAHELGHFRGNDLLYSQKFVPASHSFARLLGELAGGTTPETRVVAVSMLPAGLFLVGMSLVSRRVVTRISREREFEADRAATEVAPPAALISAISKLRILQIVWRGGAWNVNNRAVARGRARVNSCADFLALVSGFLQEVPEKKILDVLIASRTAHPFDTHPTLSARAAALAVEPLPLIKESAESLKVATKHADELSGLEEELTSIQNEYARLPGVTLTPDLESMAAVIQRKLAEDAAETKVPSSGASSPNS